VCKVCFRSVRAGGHKKETFHKRSLPNDISEKIEKMRARGRAAVKYVRAKAFRIVHRGWKAMGPHHQGRTLHGVRASVLLALST